MGKTVEKRLDSASKQVKTAVRDMTCVYHDFKKHHRDALLVRKKLAMKDVCYRKNAPDVEVFRCELAFDVEMYVLWMIVIGAGLWMAWHMKRWRRMRFREKALSGKCEA